MAELLAENIVQADAVGLLTEQAELLANQFADDSVPVSAHYKANVYHRQELSIHFRWKYSAGHLIAEVRPHEPDAILEYRLQNYEQNTFPVGFSVINAIKGTLSNKQIYSVQFSEMQPDAIDTAEGEDFETYMTEGAAVPGGDFIAYFWDLIAIQCMLDPNGYVVIINNQSDTQVQKRNVTNPADNSVWREPRPFFIPSSHVMAEGDGFMFAKSTELTSVQVGDKAFSVPVFWYFTEDITFRVVAESGREVQNPETRKKEIQFDWLVEHWDVHGAGICAKKPRGIVSDERVWMENGQQKRHVTVMEMDDVGFFLSILSLAVPDFNRAVKILSDLESGLVASLFPIKTVELQGCPDCDGKGWNKDTRPDAEEGDTLTCGTCKGRGKVFPTGPFAGVAKAPNEQGVISPSVVWSAPPTDSFEFAWRMYNEAILSGLKALAHGSLRQAPSNSNDTARAKEIDLTQQHIIVRDAAGVIYPMLQWLLDKANVLRYGKILDDEELRQNRAVVMEPSSFDITLMADLFDQLEKMRDVAVPASIKKIWAGRAISRDLGTTSPMGRLARTFLAVDKYAMMTEEEIMTANARYLDAGEATRLDILVDLYLHDNLEKIVMHLVDVNAGLQQPIDFLALPATLQVSLARQEAKTRVELERQQADPVQRDDNGAVIGRQGATGRAAEAPDDTDGAEGSETSGGQQNQRTGATEDQ
jgi:hypothetical protein